MIQRLAPDTYCTGQALFDKNDPTSLVDQLDQYFMKPDRGHEIAGQVNKVCFAEGLVNFRDQMFLYFGTADSKIAVAVKR